MQTVYSVGDMARRLTRISGEYVAAGRVANAVRRLITSGELVERRAGRQHVLLEEDIPVVEAELGIVGKSSEVTRHG